MPEYGFVQYLRERGAKNMIPTLLTEALGGLDDCWENIRASNIDPHKKHPTDVGDVSLEDLQTRGETLRQRWAESKEPSTPLNPRLLTDLHRYSNAMAGFLTEVAPDLHPMALGVAKRIEDDLTWCSLALCEMKEAFAWIAKRRSAGVLSRG